ncbi:MAG: hypothetical protein ACLFRL_07890 [Desulfohalobiaceae bacterium]
MPRQAWLILVCLTFVLLGCGPKYPLDIPEEEWQNMSAEERLQAREKQAELDKAEQERRKAEAEAREAEAIEWLQDQEASRQNAEYGERLQCVLDPAQAYLGGSWRDIEPLALDVVQGMILEKEIKEVRDGYIRRRETIYAGFDGQTLSLCERKQDVQRQASEDCLHLLGTFEEYSQGVNKKLQADSFLRARIRCDLGPGQDMPSRLRLER